MLNHKSYLKVIFILLILDNEYYEVEAIVDHKYNKKGRLLLEIKWLGYDDPKDNDWKSIEKLSTCKDLVEDYMNRHKLASINPRARH